MKSSYGISAAKAIITIVLLLILIAILLPAFGPEPSVGRKAIAKSDVTQIATAVIAFREEYGHFPETGQRVVDGRLLAALMGNDDALNPRKIVFLEPSPASKQVGGVRNKAFVDPWGGPYQIAIAQGADSSVIAGTNNIQVKKLVAVWNDPRLGADPPWWQFGAITKKQNRYVTSWE